MSRYACNFAGQCDEHANGQYATREECEAKCEGQEGKEILYEINSMDLESAMALPTGDQIEIIQRLWGFRPEVEDVRTILELMNADVYDMDWEEEELLEKYPRFKEVFHQKFDVVKRLLQGRLAEFFFPNDQEGEDYERYEEYFHSAFSGLVEQIEQGGTLRLAARELTGTLAELLIPERLYTAALKFAPEVEANIQDYLEELQAFFRE